MKNYEKLVLEPNARNHFKVLLLGVDNIPESEKEQILLAEKMYNELEQDNNREKLYRFSSQKKGIMISVFKSNNRGYLIQSIKNEFETYNNTVYVSDNINDLVNIAKFLRSNITDIMSDYKQQILDAKDMYVPNIDNSENENGDDTRNLTC